ncbi:protein adenylyltransferase SelO [Reinekea thalattae]|uniref:Protein nucleotidyltransferase YdiU n=1 Tax=Reinekea thalattae TaxID=2593301 RepID=A0A5C8ZA36_9GAMM|nr:YdiU family protein [Reinekea thalattae]TXR54627.1 YdiU family protein [Reinekea thalattae]
MKFQHSYKTLGADFYQSAKPVQPSKPELLLWNERLAEELQIGELTAQPALAAGYFSGAEIPASAEPIALAYAGHQFGYFNPQLGDGRAHLLGELEHRSGQRLDIQLKGSGPTLFSRRGDGRCALKPALREFIMSEAMHALAVPTTRCLSVVATGEPVFRDMPQAGAVVTRVAASHIRVGTFEYFAAKQDKASLEKLLDYAISRHYPSIDINHCNKAALFLQAVIDKQIHLVCEWLRVGFIHGVMNTDNCAISGETIDYGPCAMLGRYQPNTVYSSIDKQGRYAFSNQPAIIHWNMARLAEALMVLETGDDFQTIIDQFQQRFQQRYLATYRKKLGLVEHTAQDAELITKLLTLMQQHQLDYTQSFILLEQALSGSAPSNEIAPLNNWVVEWKDRIGFDPERKKAASELMQQTNPLIIPRNHHVEAVLEACEQAQSGEPAKEFLAAIRSPYQPTITTQKFQSTDPDYDQNYQTFCGT